MHTARYLNAAALKGLCFCALREFFLKQNQQRFVIPYRNKKSVIAELFGKRYKLFGSFSEVVAVSLINPEVRFAENQKSHTVRFFSDILPLSTLY